MRNLPRAAFWLTVLGLVVLLSLNLTAKTASKAAANL